MCRKYRKDLGRLDFNVVGCFKSQDAEDLLRQNTCPFTLFPFGLHLLVSALCLKSHIYGTVDLSVVLLVFCLSVSLQRTVESFLKREMVERCVESQSVV